MNNHEQQPADKPEAWEDETENELEPQREEETAEEPVHEAGSEVEAASVPAVRRSAAPWPWIAIAVAAVIALAFVLVQDGSGAGSDNAVVGRMDGASFTKADMYDEMVKQMGDAQAASALDNLMLLKVVDLEADKQNIKVTDADVNAEIDLYKKHFGGEEAFQSALDQSGMSLDALKEQVGITVKLRKIFEPQIKPTEDQLKQHYEDNKEAYGTPEKVRASHILLETKEEAEAVLAQLKNGADFAALAKEKSIDPGSSENGGDLDYFGKGEMNEEFETAAFALQKGETSGVVESPDGFHIIKLTDRQEAVVPTYDEVKPEVTNEYLDQEIQTRFEDWLTEKKKEYHYENTLAKAVDTTAPALEMQ